jgi:glycine oxidase
MRAEEVLPFLPPSVTRSDRRARPVGSLWKVLSDAREIGRNDRTDERHHEIGNPRRTRLRIRRAGDTRFGRGSETAVRFPFVGAPNNIVVIGAGIVGCAIAYELARRGASVQIVDDRLAGMGATQASAGVLAPYIEASEGGTLLELTARSLGLFEDFVARVTSDSGMSVMYRRTGTLDVAMDGETLVRFGATCRTLAARGVAAELLDAEAARRAEPQLNEGVLGALLIPSQGFVAATALTRALAAAARRHGAHLLEHGRVLRIARASGELAVVTDRGSLTGAVVLAAGSWSGQIEIEGVSDRVPVRPVRGQLLQLAWNGPPLGRVVWSERCYLVPWEDGTLLVGATVEDAGFDERTTSAGVHDLLEAACELVPRAWTATFVAARAGLRPATADELPVIGASGAVPNLMYATGHFRNGVLLSPLTADLVADAVLENRFDPILAATNPCRFGTL